MTAMPLFQLERRQTMRKYLYSENGFTEKAEWQPNCWVNVECPDNDDFKFLTEELKVPESFLEDIADVDERPRTETEDNWLLTILRIPMQSNQRGVPFITVPIGIITNDGIIVSVCYHHTELIPDFIQHTRRKNIVVNNKLDLILRIRRLVPEVSETDKQRCGHRRKRAGEKHPQRRSPATDEAAKDAGLLQHFHPWQ